MSSINPISSIVVNELLEISRERRTQIAGFLLSLSSTIIGALIHFDVREGKIYSPFFERINELNEALYRIGDIYNDVNIKSTFFHNHTDSMIRKDPWLKNPSNSDIAMHNIGYNIFGNIPRINFKKQAYLITNKIIKYDVNKKYELIINQIVDIRKIKEMANKIGAYEISIKKITPNFYLVALV